MGRSSSLPVLLISLLLVLSSVHGFGRKGMQTFKHEEESAYVPLQENAGFPREMMELDYVEAGPNTNPRSGYVSLSPPAPPLPKANGRTFYM